jgi:hypothetical protein
MTKAVWSAITTVVLFSTLAVGSAYAQATGTLTVNVNVGAKAKLTIGPGTIAFADADPDVVTTLTSPAVTIDVKARTSAAGSVTLTVLAGGDLVSTGNPNIGINNLEWTTGGTGFAAGTANSTTPQPVGSWSGSGTQSGSQVFTLPNSWTYATGTYSVTLTYTLTAP